MQFAMGTASARYRERIERRLAALGDDLDPRRIVRVLLGALLPADHAERDDARVALAFQAYAATHADASAHLEEGNALLRQHLTELVRAADAQHPDPVSAATGLLAAAEGLGVHMLSSRLDADRARAALDHLIGTVLGGR